MNLDYVAQNATILNFTGAKDDGGGGGDNWSYKICKTAVKLSASTSQKPSIATATAATTTTAATAAVTTITTTLI